MSPGERGRLHELVLELLERRHGVGLRSSGVSGWMGARLDRALDSLVVKAGGDPGRVIEFLGQSPSELEEIADLLRVGETRFFRDGPQWEALRKNVLSAFENHERLRGLSVGCSTGEEAWTLAMILDEACARIHGGPTYRVVGMDRSEVALETARVGSYPKEAARDLPSDLSNRYLVTRDDALMVGDTLRSASTFVLRDAMIGPPPGNYEIIVCKNVLIYFGDDAAERVLTLLMRTLADDGLLLVAKSEVPRVRALGHRAEEIAPGVSVFRA